MAWNRLSTPEYMRYDHTRGQQLVAENIRKMTAQSQIIESSRGLRYRTPTHCAASPRSTGQSGTHWSM